MINRRSVALTALLYVTTAMPPAVAQQLSVADFYNQTSLANMKEMVEKFYASDCVFEDPVTHLEGRDKLLSYYRHMYEGVSKIRFELATQVRQGDEGFASWTMYLNTPKLEDGETVTVKGVSQFRYRGDLVVYHRDYFDLGEMVYEHVPVVGWLTRKVKARLGDHES
ncbi:MAG: nuclear transport factor 2 family protein [Deltaproteobacteria bacterium]|nr:nuclear transport factor 2 family protein [Deltaproteobacteria bacterium]